MADGIALIEINEQGEGRLKEENGLQWLDFRLENVCFDDAEGTDQICSQLPDDLKNVLVLVTFDYVCHCSRSWEGDYDCEELFNVVSHTVLKEDYKEFSRHMITEELNEGIGGFENLDCIPDSDYYKELIENWEEFHDEDFVPFERERKRVINLMDIINQFD